MGQGRPEEAGPLGSYRMSQAKWGGVTRRLGKVGRGPRGPGGPGDDREVTEGS